jgi:hypothetical protein
MFNKTKATASLFGLVGFDNPTNPTYAIVDSANRIARSGRTATENPYVKIEYLKETQDHIDISNADFNAFLSSLQRKSIADVIDKILTEPSYIDRQLLYQFPNNKRSIENLPEGFVGYRIQTSREKNVAFEITRCFLEFFGEGSVELMLFSTAESLPLFKKTIQIDSTNEVEKLNWRIDNTGNYFSGDFYLGYFANDLPVQPIKRDYQNANIKSTIAHLCFTPIYANAIDGNMFDVSKIGNRSECWGLNPDITVFNDYTDLIIQNEMLFAPAVQLQIVINCIQHYIASSRSNRTQRITQEQINLLIAQLEGVEGSIKGLIPTLAKEVASLSKQLKRLTQGYFAHGYTLNTLT